MILEYHDKDREHGIQMGEEYIRMLIAYCTFYPLSFALLCRLGSTRPLVLILLDAYVCCVPQSWLEIPELTQSLRGRPWGSMLGIPNQALQVYMALSSETRSKRNILLIADQISFYCWPSSIKTSWVLDPWSSEVWTCIACSGCPQISTSPAARAPPSALGQITVRGTGRSLIITCDQQWKTWISPHAGCPGVQQRGILVGFCVLSSTPWGLWSRVRLSHRRGRISRAQAAHLVFLSCIHPSVGVSLVFGLCACSFFLSFMLFVDTTAVRWNLLRDFPSTIIYNPVD